MLLKLFEKLPKRRVQLICLLVLMLCEAAFAAVSITMLIPMTQAVLGSSESQVWFLKYVPPALLARPDWLFLLFGLLLVVKVLLSMARSAWSGYFAEKLRTEWQSQLTRHLVRQPYQQLVRGNRGAMISDVVQQTSTGSAFVMRYLNYVAQIIVMLGICAAMLLVNWQVTLALPAIAIIGWFIVGQHYYAAAGRLGRRSIKLNRQLTSEMVDTLTGIKEVKITASETYRIGNIQSILSKILVNRIWTRLLSESPIQGAELAFGCAVLVVFSFVGSNRAELEQLLPVLVFFSAGLLRILLTAASIVSIRFDIVNKFAAFLRITERLLPDAETEVSGIQRLPVDRLASGLSFENVDFAYDSASPESEPRHVLRGVNFELPLGKVICLFGPSGSGKTTIVDLIVRLFEPTAGRIVANGRNIDEFDLKDWRRVIGYVGQEPYMFQGTIEDNIRLGETRWTAEDVQRAAVDAAAIEFIETLPDKFQTSVGDQGASLSGGQKRRIALARALIRQPSLLILDETTNALDETMERDLIRALSAGKNLTILLISHRAVSAQFADLALTLEDGAIRVAAGTTAEPAGSAQSVDPVQKRAWR